MARRPHISVEGVDDVALALSRVGTKQPAFRKALGIAASLVRREYRSQLPRLTGYMRKRIKVKLRAEGLTLAADVYPTVYYALFLERGVSVVASTVKVAKYGGPKTPKGGSYSYLTIPRVARAGRSGVAFGGFSRVKQVRINARPHAADVASASQARVTQILGDGFTAGVR